MKVYFALPLLMTASILAQSSPKPTPKPTPDVAAPDLTVTEQVAARQIAADLKQAENDKTTASNEEIYANQELSAFLGDVIKSHPGFQLDLTSNKLIPVVASDKTTKGK